MIDPKLTRNAELAIKGLAGNPLFEGFVEWLDDCSVETLVKAGTSPGIPEHEVHENRGAARWCWMLSRSVRSVLRPKQPATAKDVMERVSGSRTGDAG